MPKLYIPDDVRRYAKLTDTSRTKDLICNAYSVLVFLLLPLFFLGACLPASLTDWVSPNVTETKTTTLYVAVGTNGEAGDLLLQTLVDEYTSSRNAESAPTGGSASTGDAVRIEVQLQIVPQYTRSLPALLDSDTPPDLFLVDTFTLPRIVANGGLRPLTGSNDVALPAATLDDLYPEVQAAFTLDGSLYCLPYEYTTLALIYNRELFEVSALPYPDEGWQWQDLQGAAQQITETTNDFYSTFGMVLDADVSRWLPFLYQAGGSVLNNEQSAITLDSQAGLQSLEFYLGLNLDGYAVESLDLSSSWTGEAFGTGRVGMIIEGSWIINYLDKEYPNLDYGVSPLPRGAAQNATVLFGNCYGISTKTQNLQEALRLMDYLTSAEVMARWQAVTNLLPTRIRLEEETLADRPKTSAFIDGIRYAEPWQFPLGFEAVVDALNGSMQQVFDAEIDPAEVLRVGQVIGDDVLRGQE